MQRTFIMTNKLIDWMWLLCVLYRTWIMKSFQQRIIKPCFASPRASAHVFGRSIPRKKGWTRHTRTVAETGAVGKVVAQSAERGSPLGAREGGIGASEEPMPALLTLATGELKSWETEAVWVGGVAARRAGDVEAVGNQSACAAVGVGGGGALALDLIAGGTCLGAGCADS